MKQGLAFFGLAAAMVLGAAWGITVLRPDPIIARSVWSSAGIALGVQVLAFAIARPFVATNPIAGWGLGSLLRMGVVMLHAVFGVKVLGLPFGPALMSLVGFLFVTMLIEPLFLKQ